jgi:hypothetical protein
VGQFQLGEVGHLAVSIDTRNKRPKKSTERSSFKGIHSVVGTTDLFDEGQGSVLFVSRGN